jgi:hypothetical protein
MSADKDDQRQEKDSKGRNVHIELIKRAYFAQNFLKTIST